MVVPGLEKDLNINISNNCIEPVKQTDDNTQINSGINTQLETTESNIIPEPSIGLDITTQTDSSVIKDQSTQTKGSSIVNDISSPPYNNTIKQPIKRHPKPKQIKPKPISKIKSNKILDKYTPENLNIVTKDQESFANISKDNNLASTQPASQSNSKAIIKKSIYKRTNF